jgi:hypothetical protein
MDEPDLNRSDAEVFVRAAHPRSLAYAGAGDATSGWLILAEEGGLELGRGATVAEAWESARLAIAGVDDPNAGGINPPTATPRAD